MFWWQNWFMPKAFNEGFLPKKDGHQVFFQEFGNPKGKPIIVFHGGPGGKFSAKYAKTFDLKTYRVIGFDQRGCGKSLPLGEIKHNTTQDLIDDTSRLLDFLKIDGKVILRGASWGSTLALLWAIKNPQRVDMLLLSQIFLADEEAEIWENKTAALFYPEFVAQMQAKAGKKEIPEYYAKLINSKNPEKQLEAINTYGMWERVRSSLLPAWGNAELVEEKELAEQKIYVNYAASRFNLSKREILDNLNKIKQIPTLIVHNRLDFVCPLKGAYDLYQGLKCAKLVIVPEKGHFGALLSKVRDFEIRAFLRQYNI